MEKKAAIYCRLSREDDNLACDEVSESIQNQQKLLCEYAKKMDSLSIVCMWMKIILDLIINVLLFAA